MKVHFTHRQNFIIGVKLMKKIIFSFVLLIILSAILAGCSGKNAGKSGDVTLTMFSTMTNDSEKNTLRSIADDFEKENEGIKIDISFPGPDYENMLRAQHIFIVRAGKADIDLDAFIFFFKIICDASERVFFTVVCHCRKHCERDISALSGILSGAARKYCRQNDQENKRENDFFHQFHSNYEILTVGKMHFHYLLSFSKPICLTSLKSA